jgi:hypothetical protein
MGPVVTVPSITLEGDANGAPHPEPSEYAKKFSGKYEHRTNYRWRLGLAKGESKYDDLERRLAEANVSKDRRRSA